MPVFHNKVARSCLPQPAQRHEGQEWNKPRVATFLIAGCASSIKDTVIICLNFQAILKTTVQKFQRSSVFSMRRSGISHMSATTAYRPTSNHRPTKASGIAAA